MVLCRSPHTHQLIGCSQTGPRPPTDEFVGALAVASKSFKKIHEIFKNVYGNQFL
jgi:hypothetical protein